MTTWTLTPAASDFDRAGQHAPVRDSDRGIGPDTTALAPPAETARTAIDSAGLADRVDQAWITPLDLDDDHEFTVRAAHGPASG